MYFWSRLAFAILVAAVFTLLFVLGLRRPGPWNNFFIFFLIILLTVWAAALWMGPVGPAFYGIYWLPLIVIGFFVAVLLASIRPSSRSRPQTTAQVYEEEQRKRQVKDVLDVFFWILLALLVVLIFIGLFRPGVIS